MTKSELLAVMTGGMATIAGGVMAAYIAMLGTSFASAANGMETSEAQQLFAERLVRCQFDGCSCGPCNSKNTATRNRKSRYFW